MKHDLTNRQFGKLTAVCALDKKLRGNIVWQLKCKCGNITESIAANLNRGHKISCGCAQKEFIKQLNMQPVGQSSKKRILHRYKLNAKKRNLSWNIPEDIFFKLIYQNCAYCGIEPLLSSKSQNPQGNGQIIFNGIDRINSQLPYLVDNVVPCCKQCNYTKGNATFREFKNYILRISNFLKLQGNLLPE